MEETFGGYTTAQIRELVLANRALAVSTPTHLLLELLDAINGKNVQISQMSQHITALDGDRFAPLKLHDLERLALAINVIANDLKEDTISADGPTTCELLFEDGRFKGVVTWWHHDGPLPEFTQFGKTLQEVLIDLADQIAAESRNESDK